MALFDWEKTGLLQRRRFTSWAINAIHKFLVFVLSESRFQVYEVNSISGTIREVGPTVFALRPVS